MYPTTSPAEQALCTGTRLPQEKHHHPDADGTVSDIEGWPVPLVHVNVKKIDDHPETDPIDDIPDRPAENHDQCPLADEVTRIVTHEEPPHRGERHSRRNPEHHLAEPVAKVGKHAEGDPLVKGEGEIKEAGNNRMNLARLNKIQNGSLSYLIKAQHQKKEPGENLPATRRNHTALTRPLTRFLHH